MRDRTLLRTGRWRDQSSARNADSGTCALLLMDPRYTVVEVVLTRPTHKKQRPVLRGNRKPFIFTWKFPSENNWARSSKSNGQDGTIRVNRRLIVAVGRNVRRVRVVFGYQETVKRIWDLGGQR